MKITRRTFTCGLAAAFARAAMQEASHAAVSAETDIHKTELESGWDLYADSKLLQSEITLPHAVANLSWHNWQPSSWERVWVYRKKLYLPAPPSDQRLFLNIERALAEVKVTVNGQLAGSHEGGFTPFECEITRLVRDGANEIEIEVDSRWLNLPPSGSPRGASAVDYYLPGGLNGGITLHAIPRTAIRDVWTQPRDILSGNPSLNIFISLDSEKTRSITLTATLSDGTTPLKSVSQALTADAGIHTIELEMQHLAGIKLWNPDNPHLYWLKVTLTHKGKEIQTTATRIGFREAKFELDGFYLNGTRTRLFGLNRHELFPYVGFAASNRSMLYDAAYLKNVLNCNVVRCSHYPQSTAFLDACDELGLMVWEEIPGWQYIGDAVWKEIAIRNTEEMIRRDRHHASIIVWGTRVNESANDSELYERTHALAKRLDPTRPTSGSMTPSSRSDWKKRWHEDVFAFDDYHASPDGTVGIDPALPGVPYMLAEAVGQYSYGTAKNFLRRYRRAGLPEEQNAQALLHAQAHDRAAGDPRNAGVIAWCAYDYASPMNAYNGVKCPGVVDSFRIPKLGASFYMAQIAPSKRIVLEPSFYWDAEHHTTSDKAAVFSNCEELHFFLDGRFHAVSIPDRVNYPQLLYPPFFVQLPWNDVGKILRINGYIGGKKVISRSFSGRRDHDVLWIRSDDREITADGIDSTRISFGVADLFGNSRPIADGTIRIHLEGQGLLIGDSEFDLRDSGGVGAVWLKGKRDRPGRVAVSVTHPSFNTRSIAVTMTASRDRPHRSIALP
jgi:beta-galactosidase